jgi:F-type H+-transporting ATPase subunit b
LTRALRQAVLFSLLGICLAGISSPVPAWGWGLGAAAEEEQKPGRELLYKVINFAILVGGLGYLLRKPLAEFLTSRSASIHKSLDEGRKALEASEAQLHAVEEKLRHVEEEIAAYQASAAREMEAEGQRLRQAAEADVARMLEATRAQMDALVRGAKLELKNHTAREALSRAEEQIRARLGQAGRERLVSEFVASLEAQERKN